jgi:soluble P-type ATPase
MFQIANSICVVGREGASGKTLAAADIVVTRPKDALDLLLKHTRIIATLHE